MSSSMSSPVSSSFAPSAGAAGQEAGSASTLSPNSPAPMGKVAALPCPCCGCENLSSDRVCRVCDFNLQASGDERQIHRCARCASALDAGALACTHCGLSLNSRLRRPETSLVRAFGGAALDGEFAGAASAPAGQGLGQAVGSSPSSGPNPSGGQAGSSISPEPAQAHISRVEAGVADTATGLAVPVAVRAPLRGAAFEDTRRPFHTTLETGAMPGSLRVVVIENDGSEGASLAVPSSGLYVGRTGCGLSFPNDPFVSPVHALVRAHATGIEICDLDSRNGIYVRLSAPTRMALGDAFLVGQQLLRLEALGPEVESSLDGAGVFTDVDGVRAFGSVVEPAWAKLVRLAIGEFVADSYLLTEEEVTVGRDSGDIRFPGDAFLSRRHVQIQRVESEHGVEALLSDLNSANGTYVRIRGSCIVPSGTFVRVGDEVLRLRND